MQNTTSATLLQEATTKNKTKEIYETNRNTRKTPFDKASLEIQRQKTKRHVT
jgi:hypothetical protein